MDRKEKLENILSNQQIDDLGLNEIKVGLEIELIWPIVAIGADRMWDEKDKDFGLKVCSAKSEVYEIVRKYLKDVLSDSDYNDIEDVRPDQTLNDKDLGSDDKRVGIKGSFGDVIEFGTGVEIVTRPINFNDSILLLKSILIACDDYGAFSNESCGFHVNLSFKNDTNNYKIDYGNLCSVLPSFEILKLYNRQNSDHCKDASFEQISTEDLNVFDEFSKEKIKIVKLNPLIKLLTKGQDFRKSLWGLSVYERWLELINKNSKKYALIDRKNKDGGRYFEFRHAGGSDYEKSFTQLIMLMKIYANSMKMALNPAKVKNLPSNKLS